MADEEQLRILKQGPEAWNAWRREYHGREVCLWYADLSGAHLGVTDLRQADLNGAHLSDADLTGCSEGWHDRHGYHHDWP